MGIRYDAEQEAIIAGDEAIEIEDFSDGMAFARVEGLGIIASVAQKDVEEGICIECWSTDGFGTYLFHEAVLVRRQREPAAVEFRHHQPNKYWEGRFGLATLLEAMAKQISHHGGLVVAETEFEDDWKRLDVRVPFAAHDETVGELVERAAKELVDVHREAVAALAGMTWKSEYETNERMFCLEILAPLLRRMGFLSVHYAGGPREFGKDFTFSEPTRFGHLRHYGLQAKCGDLRGNVNSDVDEIIGQLKDAFSMPYVDVSSSEERHISTFVVAISGRFTDNAKEKIVKKMPLERVGAVVFLDREKLMELVEQHWVERLS